MKNTYNYKCPKCEKTLKSDLEGQNFKCEYCDKTFNLDNLNSIQLNKQNTNNEIYIYNCKNCNSQILSSINITSCIYCKNNVLEKNKLEKDFDPEYIIPFKTTKIEIIRKCKNNWLKSITQKDINKIKAIYVPCSIYDFDTTGEVEFECNTFNSWVSDGYRYTKKDKHKFIRGGNISFKNILVSGSKKFQEINSIEPYDYKDLKKFDYSYLSEFLSEKYNISKEELDNEATKKVKTYFVEEMKKDIKDCDEVITVDTSINLYNSKSRKILLPVWFLELKYKNKNYTILINGQTGKTVGEFPIRTNKIIFIWLVLFIVISIVLLMLQVII